MNILGTAQPTRTELCVHPKRQGIALAFRPSLYRVYFVLFLLLFFKDEIRTLWESGYYMEVREWCPSLSICNEICKIARSQPVSGSGSGPGLPAHLTHGSPSSEWVV